MAVIERAVHLTKALTTTQERILGDNGKRRMALFVNDSDSVAYLGLGIPAEANKGIRVNASGGSYEINLTNPFFGEVYAVSTGVTKVMLITEVSNAS